MNVLLVLYGVLAALSVSLCGILIGLGAGITNLILLFRGEIGDVGEKLCAAGNTAAMIAGLINVGVGGYQIFKHGSQTNSLIILGAGTVMIMASILTWLAYDQEYG